MPNWLVVVIIIAALVAFAGLCERFRLKEMDRFAAGRGLRELSPSQTDPALAELAEQLEGRPPARWGSAFSGIIDGRKVTVAEYQAKGRGLNSAQQPQTQGIWHVMIAWQTESPSVELSAEALLELPRPNMARLNGLSAIRFQGFLTTSNARRLLSLAGLGQASSQDAHSPSGTSM